MRLAILCAPGIGDALIFHSLSPSLGKTGWESVTFSDCLSSFNSWLPLKNFEPRIPVQELEAKLSGFDAVFLQHDNSPFAFRVQNLRLPVYVFYGSHSPLKHKKLRCEFDYVCDRTRNMVDNAGEACRKFFGTLPENSSCFVPPPGLIRKRYPRRVLIHPFASCKDKMWGAGKFLKLRNLLRKLGWDARMTAPPWEKERWDSPPLPTLGDLASYIYESAAFIGNDSAGVHLASLLRIPHLAIAGDGLQMPLWSTGWLPGTSISPPRWLMRYKYARKRWRFFISVKSVIKEFRNINVINDAICYY